METLRKIKFKMHVLDKCVPSDKAVNGLYDSCRYRSEAHARSDTFEFKLLLNVYS